MAKEDRGFASMDRSKQREIASKGGKAVHQPGMTSDGSRWKKKPHKWTCEEAREAGRKGGTERHRRKRVSDSAAAGSRGVVPGDSVLGLHDRFRGHEF